MSHNRIVVMYFFASLTFLLAGLSLSAFTQTRPVSRQSFGPAPSWTPIPAGIPYSWNSYPYRDLGLSLYGFGLFLVAVTFYQSLTGKKKEKELEGNIFSATE